MAVTVPVSAAQAWTISQSELQASYEVTPENYPGAAAAIDGAPEAPDLRPVPLWSEVDDESVPTADIRPGSMAGCVSVVKVSLLCPT